jgi:hypothetical protein
VVTLKSGKKLEGVARNRNNYSLQMIDRSGELHLLSMRDVEKLEISPHSPMPADYAKRLSKTELENLLAYLAQQAMRRADPVTGEASR